MATHWQDVTALIQPIVTDLTQRMNRRMTLRTAQRTGRSPSHDVWTNRRGRRDDREQNDLRSSAARRSRPAGLFTAGPIVQRRPDCSVPARLFNAGPIAQCQRPRDAAQHAVLRDEERAVAWWWAAANKVELKQQGSAYDFAAAEIYQIDANKVIAQTSRRSPAHAATSLIPRSLGLSYRRPPLAATLQLGAAGRLIGRTEPVHAPIE